MTKKINLIKRSSTIEEFRTWLYQMIQDKKGALPDLDDWKIIKEQLDKVGTTNRRIDNDGSGFQSDDDEYTFDFEPYNFQFTLDLFDELCKEAINVYDDVHDRDGLYNEFHDEYAHSRGVKYKEYDNGQTETESSREDDPNYDF